MHADGSWAETGQADPLAILTYLRCVLAAQQFANRANPFETVARNPANQEPMLRA